MKVPAAALAALLLVAICSLAEAQLGDSSVAVSSQKTDTVPTECCFSYRSHRIPRRYITSAYTTSSICSLPAVILVTKKGRKVCADPKAPWLKVAMKHFQLLEY